VLSNLVTRIVAGEYRSGDLLPPEAALGDQFGVSRTVVREATKVLEDKGLVHVRQGHGCIVMPIENWRVMDEAIISAQLEHDHSGRVFEDFTFVRVALESEMAARAAERLTPEFERRGRELLDLAAGHTADPEVFLEFDYAFHVLVMEASGNPIACGLMTTLRGPLHATRRLTNQIPGTIEHGQEAHEEIFRAIVDRNSDGARRAMRLHLEWLQEQMRRSGLLRAKNTPEEAGSGGSGRQAIARNV
jgi:Transcriptional regulators